jgi:23S rRNA pseudouridine1911/1915/1917 synthase
VTAGERGERHQATAGSGEVASVEYVVMPAEAGARLDQFLAAKGLPFSRAQLARRIEAGEVALNDRPAKPAARLRTGDRVHFRPPPPVPVALEPEAIPLAILHEDAHLIVVDKPAGMVVHPAAGHARGTLVAALLSHCRDLAGIGGELRPGIVHRLDKDTSGVLVVAKDEPTLVALQARFKAHDLERRYLALVAPPPRPPAGEWRTHYGRDPRDRKKFSSRVATGKPAITRYTTLEVLAGGAAALVEAQLLTGRTHQIRVHFRDHGSPVVGDPVYARPPRDPRVREVARALGRQALHARVLALRHPQTGAALRFESPPPPDFAAALERLRGLGP